MRGPMNPIRLLPWNNTSNMATTRSPRTIRASKRMDGRKGICPHWLDWEGNPKRRRNQSHTNQPIASSSSTRSEGRSNERIDPPARSKPGLRRIFVFAVAVIPSFATWRVAAILAHMILLRPSRQRENSSQRLALQPLVRLARHDRPRAYAWRPPRYTWSSPTRIHSYPPNWMRTAVAYPP